MPAPEPSGTTVLAPDAQGIARAAGLLAQGGLVAFPTETVYGLGADARNPGAVARVFAAKGRPLVNPLIAHVVDTAAAALLTRLDARAERLAAAFWPGALTLVLPMREGAGIAPQVTAGLPTLAVRVPSHPVAKALLAAFGGPVAAPSANPSGRISPTRAEHVIEALGGRIEAVLDGGPCAVGLESTILALDGPEVRLLRPGGVPVEAIKECLGVRLLTVAGKTVRPQAPGMMASHYAPVARLRMNVTRPETGEVWIGFGPGCDGAALNLSADGDLDEAATALFTAMRVADVLAGPGGSIAVAPVPEQGLGLAINDRLQRAAAPRPETP